MLVRDFLRKAPVTVPVRCTIQEAAHLMGAHEVGSVLVLSGFEVVGIVTDRDIAVRGVGAGRPSTSTVEAVMTEHPVTIQASADIFDAYQSLKEAGVRRLPVLEDKDLAGIITADDLLVALVLELGAVVSPVAREMLLPEPGNR
jgi:CBS domain-containing protein